MRRIPLSSPRTIDRHVLRFGLAVALAAGILAASAVRASPPDPPVTVTLAPVERTGKLPRAEGKVGVVAQLATRAGVIGDAVLGIEVLRVDDPHQPKRRQQQRWKLTRENLDGRGVGFEVPVEGAGHYEVDARVRGGPQGRGYSARSIVHVLVDADGSWRVLTGRELAREARERRAERFKAQVAADPGHPDIRLLNDDARAVPEDAARRLRTHAVESDQQLEVRPAGPSELQRRYSVDNSATAWARKDPLTVRGRLLYLDFDGAWRPLVNVSVNLWDEDWDWDEHLGTVVTDWNGNWSFSVNNNDGWGANGRDIYYTFKLANTRIRVEDCDGIDSTYEWQSSVRDDVNDGTVIDFGSQTGSTHIKTMQIWNHLNLAWNHASTAGGQDPGFVDSCYPYDKTRWDRFWEEIDIEEGYNDGPDVVTHEYGHAVMWYAYDEDNPSPGGAHTFDDCSVDPGLAWSEGWATGFMLTQRPDGAFNWHEGDGGRNIEQFDASCRTGERNEGRVAAALHDFADGPNDTNGGDEDRGRNDVGDANSGNRIAAATLLRDTLWGSYHTDALDYWYSLSGELDTARAQRGQEIMYYNWMNVVAPGSCVASKITTRALPERDDLLADLRTFRDKALKPFPGGRRLANLYYRHSPELALILLKDERLRADALDLMRHFARIGSVLDSNAGSRKLLGGDAPVIDAALGQRIRALIAALDRGASPELKSDLALVVEVLATVEGQSFETLSARIAAAKARRDDVEGEPLRQSGHAPASREAARGEELRRALQ